MGDHSVISGFIDENICQCEEDLVLLRSPSALEDMPDKHVEELMDLYSTKGTSARGYAGTFTCVHWAAQNGRRDIIEFVRQQGDGGAYLMNSRDQHGRNPLYYAQKAERSALAHYLREEVGLSAAPTQAKMQRPSTTGLPLPYVKVLTQIETQGWHTVKWKEGYTMLHWAAEKGHTDLCRYLVQLGASTRSQNSQGRTPADCATRTGHHETASAIQALDMQTSRSSMEE